MSNIKEIVERMNSVSSMQQITKTMKLIAASKFNKAQQNLYKIKNYQKYLEDVKNKIFIDTNNDIIKKYIHRETSDNLLLVIITADKGFCGSFNSSVIKKAIEVFKINEDNCKNIDILPIGKKAYTYFKKNEYNVVTDFIDIVTKLDIKDIHTFTNWMIDNFLENKYNKILIIYNKFENATSQTVTVKQFLPIEIEVKENDLSYPEEYLFEPSKEEVLNTFIPFQLRTEITRYFFESNASEQGARMTNMTKATDNADALIKTLRIQYNQSRQAIITNEIIEISAGASAIR